MTHDRPRARDPSRARRRTVRIVQPKTTSRVTTVSLLVAGGAVVMLLVGWRIWRPVTPDPATVRTLDDVLLRYKCENGHTWHDRGGATSRYCPTCSKQTFASAPFVCAKHGTFEVEARFTDLDGRSTGLAALRLRGREWVSPAEGVPCPRCGEKLLRKLPDPYTDSPARTPIEDD